MRLTSLGLLSTVAGKSLFTFTNGRAEGKNKSEDIVGDPKCGTEFNFINRAHYGNREPYSSRGTSEKISLPQRYLERKTKDSKVFLVNPPGNQCNCGLKMVILVKSAIEHFDRRKVIRERWNIDENIRINFLIGKNLKNLIDPEIIIEAETHGDLIIGDFIDTYRNLTMKSTLGLQWGAEECGNYGAMLMVDDDIQIKLDVIMKNYPFEKQSIAELEMIHCLHQMQPKPRALRSGKWKVEKEKYNLDRYPASCTGPAILMSNRAVKILHDQAKTTEDDFPIDDIYISGILREKASLEIQKPDKENRLVRVILESELANNETIASQIL